MTKTNLVAGMLTLTADGKLRHVMSTKDGLILIASDNKALKVDKLAEDLTNGEYREDKTIVKVWDIANSINGHVFDEQDRDLLFDRYAAPTLVEEDDECCCGNPCDNPTTFAGKADLKPGMLVITRDGEPRLVTPTTDMGLVLAKANGKFIRLDKLNDDLTVRDYTKQKRNIDKVYGIASGVTTDFYSTDNRPLLFSR